MKGEASLLHELHSHTEEMTVEFWTQIAAESYLNERDIGWVACWYDDEAEPPMFQREWRGYTGYGEFVMDRLGH